MNYTQCYQPIDYLSTRQTGLSYMRVLHASPDAPAVDFYINNKLIASNKVYRSFTPYIGLRPGNYSISVYLAGQMTNPVINTNIEIASYSIYTATVIGRLSDIGLYLISDPVISPLMNKARVRFIHLSPNAPAVDLTLPNETILFANVSYKEITNYKSFNPGRYTLQANIASTTQVVLNIPNIVLRPGRNLSIYAIGLVSEEPPLQVLIPLDGSSYLPL